MRFISRGLILTAVCIGAAATHATAAVPTLINYQGRLADGDGAPLDTTVAMTFGVYDAASGGALLWNETQAAVSVTDGLFHVLLGSVNAIPDSLFAGATRYLGITVGGDPQLDPRTRLVSSPFAFRVGSVDGATGGHLDGKLSVGANTTNAGSSAFAAGESNTASGDYSTVSGGRNNRARGAYSTVGGGGNSAVADSNSATGSYSTIGGGWRHLASGIFSTIGGGDDQTASGVSSTVGGGADNGAVADFATVAGGMFNTASASHASIGGGETNSASGAWATVPGGRDNSAAAPYSFAAGRNAKIVAAHGGAMVMADSLPIQFSSAAANEFAVRATGGVRLVTALDGLGLPSAGACLAAGSGSWSMCSDIATKTDIREIEAADILARIESLPIRQWRYKSQDSTVRHIGPMAQDFHAAFGVGDDPRYITSVDADGVALAAIQELARLLRAESERAAQRIAELESQIAALRRGTARSP